MSDVECVVVGAGVVGLAVGQARFGPDVEWVDAEQYDVDPRRADAFYAAIRRYWPGHPAADFRIDSPAVHGRGGLVQLFGIESPGLTASLAIGDHVAALVNQSNAA